VPRAVDRCAPEVYLGGPFLADFSAVPAFADSVARDWLHSVVRSEPADCLAGSSAGWQAA